jgi:hypothetical protein
MAKIAVLIRYKDSMKTCTKCELIKNESEFYEDASKKSGLKSWCKSCEKQARNAHNKTPKGKASIAAYAKTPERKAVQRNGHLKRKYGITPEQYEALLAAQEGKCKICETDKPGGQGGWHVDHDHDTGQIRGLLCQACNRGIGFLKDNPVLCYAAGDYLNRNSSKKS